MKRIIHPVAGTIAILTIATFWFSTVLTELFGVEGGRHGRQDGNSVGIPVADSGTGRGRSLRICVVEGAAGRAHCHKAEAHAADSREWTSATDSIRTLSCVESASSRVRQCLLWRSGPGAGGGRCKHHPSRSQHARWSPNEGLAQTPAGLTSGSSRIPEVIGGLADEL